MGNSSSNAIPFLGLCMLRNLRGNLLSQTWRFLRENCFVISRGLPSSVARHLHYFHSVLAFSLWFINVVGLYFLGPLSFICSLVSLWVVAGFCGSMGFILLKMALEAHRLSPTRSRSMGLATKPNKDWKLFNGSPPGPEMNLSRSFHTALISANCQA